MNIAEFTLSDMFKIEAVRILHSTTGIDLRPWVYHPVPKTNIRNVNGLYSEISLDHIFTFTAITKILLIDDSNNVHDIFFDTDEHTGQMLRNIIYLQNYLIPDNLRLLLIYNKDATNINPDAEYVPFEFVINAKVADLIDISALEFRNDFTTYFNPNYKVFIFPYNTNKNVIEDIQDSLGNSLDMIGDSNVVYVLIHPDMLIDQFSIDLFFFRSAPR